MDAVRFSLSLFRTRFCAKCFANRSQNERERDEMGGLWDPTPFFVRTLFAGRQNNNTPRHRSSSPFFPHLKHHPNDPIAFFPIRSTPQTHHTNGPHLIPPPFFCARCVSPRAQKSPPLKKKKTPLYPLFSPNHRRSTSLPPFVAVAANRDVWPWVLFLCVCCRPPPPSSHCPPFSLPDAAPLFSPHHVIAIQALVKKEEPPMIDV